MVRSLRLRVTITIILSATPLLLLAQAPGEGFVPLIGVPGIDTTNLGVAAYINALYLLAISIAAFLAVGMLILAGFKYMLSDVVTQKEEAKKDIRGAILGLLIVIAAVLILETINPQLTNLRILQLQELNVPTPRAVGIPDVGRGVNRDEFTTECEAGGFNAVALPGLGRQTVCCTSAAVHSRCEQFFTDTATTPTVSRTEFATVDAANIAADACGGFVESRRSRHVAVCPIE
jgi:hypothetical protein